MGTSSVAERISSFQKSDTSKASQVLYDTPESHSDFLSAGGLCIFVAADFQKQEGSKLQQVFLNSCLFSSSVWCHVSFDCIDNLVQINPPE